MSQANAVSDLERAEHASNVLAKRVSLVDNEGSQINPATETKQDEIIGNKALRLAESGNYTYIGKADIGSLPSDPVWQIKRIDETSGLVISWADGDDLYDNIFNDYLTINFV